MTVIPIEERGEKNRPMEPSNMAFDVASLNEVDGVCESWIVIGNKDEEDAASKIVDGECEKKIDHHTILQDVKSNTAGNGALKLDSTVQHPHVIPYAERASNITSKTETRQQQLNGIIEARTDNVHELREPDLPDISREDNTDYEPRRSIQACEVNTQITKHDNLDGCGDGPVDEGDFCLRSIDECNEELPVNVFERVAELDNDDMINRGDRESHFEKDTDSYPENIASNPIISEGGCDERKDARSEEEMFLQRMCDCGTAYFFPHRRIKCAARLLVSGVKDTFERGIESGASQYKGFMRETGQDGEIEDVR